MEFSTLFIYLQIIRHIHTIQYTPTLELVGPNQTEHVVVHVDSLGSIVSAELLVGGTPHLITSIND